MADHCLKKGNHRKQLKPEGLEMKREMSKNRKKHNNMTNGRVIKNEKQTTNSLPKRRRGGPFCFQVIDSAFLTARMSDWSQVRAKAVQI